MATTNRNEDNPSASETHEARQAEAPTRYFGRTTTLQHPDTREQSTFSEGDEVPDWALTVVGADSLRPLDNPDQPEVNLGPVPARHQAVASATIGDEAPLDAPSISEQNAQPVGLEAEDKSSAKRARSSTSASAASSTSTSSSGTGSE